MKWILSLIVLLNVLFSSAQIIRNYPLNVVSFETGLFHRGLAGVSYTRILLEKKHQIVSAGGGVGIGGVPFGGGINQFYYSFISSGLGAKGNFVELGFDIRYADVRDVKYDNTVDDYVSKRYKGLLFAPFFAITVTDEDTPIYVQLRGSPRFWSTSVRYADQLGGAGVTVGRRF